MEEITIGTTVYIVKGDYPNGKYTKIPKGLIRNADNAILSLELWDRFTEEEQENLLDSSNKKIKRFLQDLRMRPSYNKIDPKLIAIIGALENNGLIGTGRAEEILS